MTPPHPAIHRLLLIAAPLLLLTGLSGLTQPPAHATPGDRPVTIVIEEITPKVTGPGTVIEVSGLLVNSTDVPITDLTVRLQRGPVLQSRSDLADYDSDPVEVNDSSTAFVNLTQPLDGAGVLPFTYRTTAEDLRLSVSGSYPLLVNVNGSPRSEPASRVGEEVILLPYLQAPPTSVTELSWLWPLVAPPERNSLGVFTGTELATSLSPGGRLDVALSTIETSPGLDGGTSTTAAPQQVTLAVDPELLEAVQVLANGDYQLLIGGQQQTSTIGSLEAANWLIRLRALAVTHPVVALPYADPDIATLTSRGQGHAVERLLPDGDSGDLVREILGVAPVTSIAWPPAGAAGSPALLDILAEHGVTQVVADDVLDFEPQPETSSLDAVSIIQTGSGPLTALVADHGLSELIGRGNSSAGSQAMTEQRFLAELVATTIAADPGSGRHLLIAPKRDFDPATAAALLRATAGKPWLGRGLATDLERTVIEPAPRTPLSTSPPSAIPGSQLSPLLSALRARDDFASALDDPDTSLLALDRALARAATVNRRADDGGQSFLVLDAVAAVSALRATVGIVPPANGTYSLASADAPLVLTVFNNNAFPVEVRVTLAPRGAPGVTTTNVIQELPAQENTTISVPANVERSGSFTVIATVSTPAGSTLGAPVQLRVQSTVYGPVALAITFGAGALLALLFARRSVQYWKRRRAAQLGGTAGTSQPPSPGALADTAQPPLVDAPRRSPV